MKSPLLIVGTLLVLLLAGALATPFFVNWSSYRAEIEEYGRTILGRDVKIAGPIDIQLLPLPTLTLEDVRVANVENATSPVFVSVKMLQARLLLAPLLRGKVQVHSVILDRPEIDLERMASGKGNWRLETTAQLANAIPLSGFSLEETKVVNGTVYVSDHRRAGKTRFDDVNLKISVGSASGPYQARGAVSHNGDPIDISISTGKFRPDGTMRLGVRVKPQTGTRLRYSFDGKLLDGKTKDIAEGRLKIAPPAIDEAVKSAPLSNIEKLPFLFNSNLTIGEEKLTFEKIELALDQSNAVTNAVTGKAEFTFGFDIGFDAELSARRLDLDALARDLGAQVAQRLKSAVSLDTLDAVAELLPKNVHGRVKISSGQLKTGVAVIEAGKLDVSVSDTGVKVRELSGLLPGRTRFELSGLYLPDPVTPQFNGAFRFNALDGRGFINWMRPGLYGEETGRIGRLKFAGSLSATPEHGRINDAKFEFDGGSGRGGLFWARSGTPFVEAEIVSDALDLTTVMPRGREAGLLDAPALVNQLNTGEAPLGLNMKIGQLTFASRTLRDFVANVKFSGSSMDIRRLAGTVGEKGQIDLAGSLAGKSSTVNGEVSGKVNSPNAIEMLQVLGSGELPSQLHDLLDGEPLDVWLEYVSNPEKNRLSVEGLAGAGLVGLSLEADGQFADWRKAKLDIDGVYETNRAHRLMDALGLGSSEVVVTGKADAKVSLLASGDLPTGLEATLKAKILNSSLDVVAKLKDPGSGLAVTGKVQVASQDASKLSAALGAGVAFNGEVALSGEFEGDKRRYRLSKIKMAMPGIKGSFDGALTPKDTTFSLTGAGRFEELSLSPVMGLLTLGPPIGGAPNSVFWADRPFRATALEQLSLDVRVSAENLILAPGVIASSASFNLRQGEGKLSLANGTGNLFGGSLQGSFLAESVTGGNLALQAKVDLNDANMADLLKDEAGQALVQGTISLEGNVEGQGRSPGGIVSVLTGKGEWSLANSRLMGTNPGGFSKSIGGVEDAAKLEGLISANLHQGVWPYKPVRSEWAVQDGLLKLAPGKITSPVAAGSVGGLANLANGKLSADWNVRVSGVENAPEYKVKLEGPIGKLVRSHDTSSLRSFLVVRVLQESMKKLEELQREQERIFQERKKSQEPAAAEPNGAEEVPANKVDEAPNQTNEKKAEAGETSAEQSAQKDTPTPEASKQIDERAAAERRKKSEESKAAEELNAAEARKSQKAREREEARKQAEARKKEQAQKEAEARQAEQARKAAEELKKVEEREKATRLASEAASRAELERLAAEAAARKVAEREADEKKAAEEKAQKEAKRKAAIAEERRKAEKARAEERAAAEELRAAQEREGGDRKALGLQQLKESRRAKDDNR